MAKSFRGGGMCLSDKSYDDFFLTKKLITLSQNFFRKMCPRRFDFKSLFRQSQMSQNVCNGKPTITQDFSHDEKGQTQRSIAKVFDHQYTIHDGRGRLF